MGRIIVSNLVSVDGFFAGPNGEIDWHNVDAEFNEYANDLLSTVDGLLFGRVTYQMMADYWPTSSAITNDPIIAEKMNSLPKIVFSRTLKKAEWKNTRLVKGDIKQEISKLKRQPGKDLVVLGSGTIVSTLTQLGLIDEYRIIVNPVVLGDGKTMFRGIRDRLSLRLLKTRTFRSGNVLLYYEPVRKQEGPHG
ncbi:MAG: riboflavin biosynthesis protein RibD [Candidatus Thorarchaeota archaeon]|nr:MAG: riboflavin biosynthesis protein RibD [Candidatus Thorarchaeota archaeon]